MTKIGQITLNISFALYLIFLWPQIIHNALQKSTQKLSFLMHLILLLAYLTDLLYGFGRNMQWQYKAVTISGLICLIIQHLQFQIYALKEQKKLYLIYSSALALMMVLVMHLIVKQELSKEALIASGTISQIGWLTYIIPQIIKNHCERSTKGLSIYFIILASIIALCDTISAWSLHWDLPSKIGAPISLILKFVLLAQFVFYLKEAKLQSPEKAI